MVTGGGGSIGSELCRQIAREDPKLLIIFDIYENNAYDIQQELKRKYPYVHVETLIGSVRNTNRLHYIFQTYHPEIIYHGYRITSMFHLWRKVLMRRSKTTY